MKALSGITLLFLVPTVSLAQVPVDDNGNAIGHYESQADIMPIGDDGIPRLSQTELQELVGPIALYPDDLLAIVLPASAYPLQVVEAARFLEALKTDPTLKPDPDWDDSIVALINYPEVVELLNTDLDWTWRLGEAVVAQQTDVVSAVESFRDRAYAAGNLKSDSYQTVASNDGVIHISPTAEDVIYVPYYEPTRVVHYQPRPVYYYHPRPHPVYYYPYAANHYFDSGYFWGVTTAFSIGWMTDSLHVYHHSYRGHPYYGRTYWNDGWYRQPSINVYNTTYVNQTNVTVNRHSNGDRWRAREGRREYVRREGYARNQNRAAIRTTRTDREQTRTNDRERTQITFRQREEKGIAPRSRVQSSETRSRDVSRDQAVASYRESRERKSTTRGRESSREQTTVRPRTTVARESTLRSRDTTTRQPQPTARTQDTSRQNAAPRARESTRRATTSRQTRERAPVRTERAPPARQERTQQPRSAEPRNSGSSAKKSDSRRDNDRRRSRDNQH